MGYYTHHKLIIQSSNSSQLINELRENNQNAKYAIDENGESREGCKWYGHVKDLRSFSKKHPGVLFTLEGIGEEQPDMWCEYYKDGKMQRCVAVISYPPFNESLLD